MLVRVKNLYVTAIHQLSEWISHHFDKDVVKIWGNGADFDNVILTSAYKRNDLELPWRYTNNRCYRTLKSLYPEIKLERSGTHHNALDDAISQANHLMSIFSHINNTQQAA